MKSIRQTALDLLARRDYTKHELQQKLLRKKFPLVDIHTTLEKLSADNLINEARFVESYIRSKHSQGYGPLRIRLALREKGIADDMIAAGLEKNTHEWRIAAEQAWKKRFKNQLPQNMRERAQHIRFLLYRGFLTEHIETIIGKNSSF